MIREEKGEDQPESQPSLLFTQVPQLLGVDTVEINQKSRTNEEIISTISSPPKLPINNFHSYGKNRHVVKLCHGDL